MRCVGVSALSFGATLDLEDDAESKPEQVSEGADDNSKEERRARVRLVTHLEGVHSEFQNHEGYGKRLPPPPNACERQLMGVS
jgi:hypothetical protein